MILNNKYIIIVLLIISIILLSIIAVAFSVPKSNQWAVKTTQIDLLHNLGFNGDDVTIDSNHPLAGVVLNFDVTIVEVREATSEETDHGHAH